MKILLGSHIKSPVGYCVYTLLQNISAWQTSYVYKQTILELSSTSFVKQIKTQLMTVQ